MTVKQRLIIGDSRRLPEVGDGEVQLVVTSPPYWQLKDYGREGQTGFDQSYEEYHDALEETWRECARVLEKGCRMVVNVGDQFTRAAVYGRYKVMPLHAEIVVRIERLGLDFMGSIIWQKVTTCNSSGGGAVMGSFPFPRNGIVKFDYEHVLLFKKPGKARVPEKEAKEGARMTTAEWNELFAGHWKFPPARGAAHLAPFPVELPRRLIRMFTFPGETVLDPFVGSGTTLVAAQELDRAGIGFDLDGDVEAIVRERLEGEAASPLFDAPVGLEVTRREEAPRREATRSEAYFGSVVKKGDRGRRRRAGVTVRLGEVTGPRSFRTGDGREVELLGTRLRTECETAAAARLEALLRGKRILLTGRDKKDLAEGANAAYVHLADRTFVNSRLIREGLLDADAEDREHPHHAKFVRESEAAG